MYTDVDTKERSKIHITSIVRTRYGYREDCNDHELKNKYIIYISVRRLSIDI
jgi:hypothetical protein